MRPTFPQLDMATLAIRTILPLKFPVDTQLRFFFRENPKIGQNDRAVIAEIVFGILRHRFFLESLTDKATPRALLLAYLIKIDGMNLRELLPYIHEGEAKWISSIKSIKVTTQPLAVQAEFPTWLVEKLKGFMSEDEILRLGLALQHKASLDLRVNTLLAKRDEVLDILKQQDIEASPTPYSPIGIRITGNFAINKDPLFLSGKVEVQDEGSQILGYLLGPRRGEMVVDFCAGAGGKALMLGALMHSQGRIYAFDVSEKRLNNLKPRLKRSGLSNIHPQRINNENDIRIKRLHGKIDRVLVDAPCSGLGTLRRNPDLKWRQTPQSIEELIEKQAAILSSASSLVKPGGRLVYATCSFLPEENQSVIEHFLSNKLDFTQLNCSELLAQQKIQLNTGKYLHLSPALHETDGFFAAALERKK